MNKFHYFFYGYPVQSNNPVYALYQPVLECFLLVVTNLEIAEKIKAFSSARFQVSIVRIDRALNYKLNLIDNEICENWKLKNFNDVNLFDNDCQSVVPAKELVETTPVINWDTDKEKQWLLLLAFYIRFFEKLQSQTHYQFVENAMVDLSIPVNVASGPRAVRENVMKEIYLGLDFDTVVNNVNKQINSNYFISQAHKTFKDSYR